VFLCVVLSCVGRGLGVGLIPCPRSPTKCLKGFISKKKNPTPEKGTRKKKKKKKLYVCNRGTRGLLRAERNGLT
jgi:hypothetical protein